MNTPLFLTFGFILRKGIGCDFNYDVCAFLLDENKKIPQDDFFVFYNNAKSPDGAVELCMEDWNKQWCINDEDFAEDMFIDLSKIDTRIQEIVFTITDEIVSGIYKPTMQNVESFILRIVTRSNNQLFREYKFDVNFLTGNAVEFGRFFKEGNEWEFETIGKGYQGGFPSSK